MDNKCWAPWNTIYEGINGNVSPCCQTPVLIETDDYEKAYQGWENLRQSFSKNIKPKECEKCPSYVQKWHTDLGHKESPIFLDLLFSNKCNFACMGCKPMLSSTIDHQYRLPISVANEFMGYTRLKGKWNAGNKKKLEYIKKNAQNLEMIHLNGGEPFLQDDLYELLEWMIKKGYNKRIKIWSHTNGSVLKYNQKDLVYDYLVHFREPEVVISLDGFGDRGEYVRWGLKEKKWLKVYNHIRDSKKVTVGVHSCYNVFNSLVFNDWYHWFLDNDISLRGRNSVTMHPWQEPEAYTVKILHSEPELLEKAKEQLLKLPKKLDRTWNQTTTLMSILMASVDETRLKPMREAFFDSITMFDIMRDTDFLQTFPELSSLYKKI